MLFLYRLGLLVYSGLMYLAALWHPKAKLWVGGRKGLIQKVAEKLNTAEQRAWFHFASLGEFEQGRPVMEALKKERPELKLVVTFFSPSGYEIRKNYALVEAVFYLPLDTPQHAADFIRLVNPQMAIFTKYEYWYFFFRELHRKRIPLYLISGIFRPKQVFFKWYGGLYRRMLGFVSHFFVQNTESQDLLAQLGFDQVSVSGDTRFDRVAELAHHPRVLPELKAFCGSSPVFIAGSTWPADEALLCELLKKYPDWKLIIAPHEVDEAHIQELMKRFPKGQAIRYTELESQNLKVKNRTTHNLQPAILIVDTIGMLSSLYAYGDVAYIGGGFGKGIHNTLEAAAYGLPVIFGPNYEKFQEAKDLIEESAGFSVANVQELERVFGSLQDEAKRKAAGKAAGAYVQNQVGATAVILKHILSYRA
ncbi:MAG: 3-deoxy-D-manno-octulosonic acid transferase [Sphingobacteriaceae bacterium]